MDRLKRFFHEKDRLAQTLGIELLEVAPGRAVTRLVLEDRHRNALGIAHGGTVFTLADVAFAAASNAHGSAAVAITANISFLKATSEGPLTAEARELSRTRRLATYAVEITDAQGDIVATFQGTVYRKNEALPIDAR